MDILDTLKRRFLDLDRNLWEPVAAAAGVGKHLPRKMVYGDRKHPRIDTCQKLITYFDAVDKGDVQLPVALPPPPPAPPIEAVASTTPQA